MITVLEDPKTRLVCPGDPGPIPREDPSRVRVEMEISGRSLSLVEGNILQMTEMCQIIPKNPSRFSIDPQTAFVNLNYPGGILSNP